MSAHPEGFANWPEGSDKSVLYAELVGQIEGLLSGETDAVANLANAAAVIYHGLPVLNWAGFYLAMVMNWCWARSRASRPA
jgi:putative methionine-R-sulfoxide reductase with GAF domain